MEKKKIETFEDLIVWQKGIEWVKQIYWVTKEGELNKDFGLRDQLRRAAVSIPTNIAEGFERNSRKEYQYFLNIAKGSAGEVRSLVRIALEINYLDRAGYTKIYNQAREISGLIANQIKALNRSQNY